MIAVLVPCLMLIQQGGLAMTIGLVSGLAWIVASVVPRWNLGVLGQSVLHLILSPAVLLLMRSSETVWHNVGLVVTTVFLSLAVPRVSFRVGGAGLATTLGFTCVAIMGQARAVPKVSFGLAVALFLFVGLRDVIRADRTWPPLSEHIRGVVLPFLFAFLLAGGVMAGLGWALPVAEPTVASALEPYMQGGTGRSGFGDGAIRLGDLSKIVTSDEVVMRVYGRTDYLRGEVLVDYRVGQWSSFVRTEVERTLAIDGELMLGAPKASDPSIKIEGEAGAGSLLFAPLDAVTMSHGPEDTALDGYGLLRIPSEVQQDARSWQLQLGDQKSRPIVPPIQRDLNLPPRDAERFRKLAQAWTKDQKTAPKQVEAIRRALGQFSYTLELPKVPSNTDPVLHFLTDAKRGHCEYFASAMALLTRSLGVPARVITGYRVFEYNPVGEWYVVRQRDAHAWVEVYYGDSWHTVEATPPGVLRGAETPQTSWIGARWDVFLRAFSLAFERLASLTWTEIAIAGGVIGILLTIWIQVRRRRTPVIEASIAWSSFDPLVALEAHVSSTHGIARTPNETLTRYAARLREAKLGTLAELVEASGRLRYGGEGDRDELTAQILREV